MISILNNDYWNRSKEIPWGILFITPLWMVYEYFAFLQNQGLGGAQRTGIDYLGKNYLHSLQIPLEFSLILPAFLVILYLAKKSSRESLAQVKLGYFAGMFVESIIYAAVLGLLTGHFVQFVLLNAGSIFDTERVSALIVNLGAGLYEEMIFRLILMSLVLFVFQSYGTKISYPIAILISSAAFALFHYLGFFEETFEWNTFLFRLVAGVCFSILFLLRGFGITVYTHSFYNIFLMLR